MKAAEARTASRHDGTSGPSPTYPVLVVDDHELFSTSLTMALRNEGFEARKLAVTMIADFLARPEREGPGLVVLDLDLGHDDTGAHLNGADLVEAFRGRGWKVLIVSGGIDEPGVASAIAAGAIGSVPKSRSFDVLVRAIADTATGRSVMSEAEHRDWLERDRRYRAQARELSRRLGRLSRREREVLELLADGMRAAAIADHFVVSMPTVRTQIRSILMKLQVGSQLEAVALSRQALTTELRRA
ncbi:MAG: LuxR C-terminal-related transcriptional regulator [Dehalococcoidia bacterium]